MAQALVNWLGMWTSRLDCGASDSKLRRAVLGLIGEDKCVSRTFECLIVPSAASPDIPQDQGQSVSSSRRVGRKQIKTGHPFSAVIEPIPVESERLNKTAINVNIDPRFLVKAIISKVFKVPER